VTRIRRALRPFLVITVGLMALVALAAPAGAITDGEEDSDNMFSDVGIVFF
jgi:hypothetical protein